MDKTVIAFIVLVAAFVVAAVMAGVSGAKHRQAEISQLAANCKVVGDAYDDEGDNGSTIRTIYQCQDGMIHIR